MAGTPLLNINTRVIGLDIVKAKLLLAAPHIILQNQLMVRGMLDGYIKPEVSARTPLGPGRNGHLRDEFTTSVLQQELVTRGQLKSPRKGYWREYGTGDRFRRPGMRSGLRLGSTNLTGRQSNLAGAFGATGGERAFMTAHQAAGGIMKLIRFWYGGLAQWWRA